MTNKKYLAALAAVAMLATIGVMAWQKKGREAASPASPNREAAVFPRSVEALPQARPSETVSLKHGDTLNLVAGFVKKMIGSSVVTMLAYNGSIPGPFINVVKGAEVTIKFTNNTDAATTIHSHGVRLANAFDGVPDFTQKPIQPGDSFTYQVKFPDVGSYWYHPHLREDYAQELGLYGSYLVTPSDAGYWSAVNRELPLMLDDILMEDGTLAAFSPKTANHALMGRFGNVMLVNGETDYRLDAKQGEVIRLYLTNAANTRTFNVAIPGRKLKLVGGDNGKYERETFVDSIVLGPSERAVVEVLFDRSVTYRLEHQTPQKNYALASITVAPDRVATSYEQAFNVLRVNRDTIASIDAVRSAFDIPADRSLRMSLAMQSPASMMGGGRGQHMMGGGGMMPNPAMMMQGKKAPIEWEDEMGMMNRQATTATLEWQLVDEATGKKNMDIDDWTFTAGDTVKIKIFNDPKALHPMQHPIHIHGQRFLALTTNGVKNENLVWKDTALIKTGDTAEFLVQMSNPGTWMAHCHIAEHLEAGMMLKFAVKP